MGKSFKTFFCLGDNCGSVGDPNYQEYESPFVIEESTRICYYSMDLNSNLIISKVLDSTDFYSLSTCRDLLFHVQEHRFTLPQIEVALNDLDLRFLGFEFRRSWIRRNFSEFYPEKDALTSLSSWHQFELKNPGTFSRMYQFWVQKA